MTSLISLFVYCSVLTIYWAGARRGRAGYVLSAGPGGGPGRHDPGGGEAGAGRRVAAAGPRDSREHRRRFSL